MKPVRAMTILVLLLVAAGHLLRLLFGVAVMIGATPVPMWVSILGVIVPSALALGLYRESRSR